MRSFKLLTVLSATFLLLSACSFSQKSQSSTDKSGKSSKQEKVFEEKSAKDLLKYSKEIAYPSGKNFVATGLNDKGYAFGEAYDEGVEDEKYLASLNLTTQEFVKIKVAEKTSDIVSFIVNYVDDDYLLFEEFDQVNQTSTYYLWDISKNKLITLIANRHVMSVHQTQVARKDSHIYLSYYVDDAQYQLEVFDISQGTHRVIEDRNSGSPTFYQGMLYYLLIDNQSLTTEIIGYNENRDQKTVLGKTQGDRRYYGGILSNGNNLLYLMVDSSGESTIEDTSKKKIYCTSVIDNPIYKGDFVEFMGERRREERVKSQYYLLDIKKRVNYLYDGGPILMSNSGILWIEFKKSDSEIPKGEIYRPENSVMRYLEWDKGGTRHEQN